MKSVTDFFTQTKNYHILVIGDVMLDRYIRGKVDRISPEAPVPVLQWQSTESRLGGAANVALNVKRLGARVSIAGLVGKDNSGSKMIELLAEEEIDHALLVHSEKAATTVKTRIIGGHQHLLRIDEERYHELEEAELEVFMTRLPLLWDQDPPDAIILQDYNKGFLTKNLITAVMSFAEVRGTPVAVDPKDLNIFTYTGVTIFKPNLRELRAKVSFPVEVDLPSLDKAAAEVKATLNARVTAVTLSEHGIFLSDRQQSGCYPTEVRTVVDVCGAGDAVISVITLAYLMGANLDQTAVLANTAGGVVCGEVGVCPVDVRRMKEEISESEGRNS
jgi:rfaE bifunctional protein kinase chain/domain